MSAPTKRQKSLKEFLGSKSKISEPKSLWKQNNSVLIYDSKNTWSMETLKIAAFDLDNTLITPLSNRRFPRDENDWRFLFPEVPKKLQNLFNEGYIIVIFTNQLGVGNDPTQKLKRQFQLKIENILEKLSSIPFLLFAAISEDYFRKPCIGMWKLFTERFKDQAIDLHHSFYVGDAAGRPHNWREGRIADHATTDMKFALNIGVQFYTPEQFFLNENDHNDYKVDLYHPKLEQRDDKSIILFDSDSSEEMIKVKDDQEVIIFVGSPAIGKSTFFENFLIQRNYIRINQDVLKTRQRCHEQFKKALSEGQSIVVDNTNPTKQTRGFYLSYARELGIPVRCLWFRGEKDLSKHLNIFRSITKGIPRLPEVAFHSFDSKFEPPMMEEGFSKIQLINFIPKFNSKEDEQIFSQYLY